jgi:hypothetical protein
MEIIGRCGISGGSMSDSNDNSEVKSIDLENLAKQNQAAFGQSGEELIQKAEALIKEGEELRAALAAKGSTLQVTDLSSVVENVLSEQAKNAMSRKATSLAVFDTTSGNIIAECIYLCVRVQTAKIEAAARMIAGQLNLLAAKDQIHSTLAPISSIDLVREFGKVPTSAVLAYVLVPVEEKEQIEKSLKYIVSLEKFHAIELLDITLADGEFLADIRVSVVFGQQVGKETVDMCVKEQVDRYLAVLPVGTELVRLTQCGITDLSIPFEAIFRNPLLKNVKQVELEYGRASAIVDEKMVDFNVVTGMKYIDTDGGRLFT